MSRVLVLVEGETEEQFVKSLLVPHFEGRGIYVIPKITTTKRQPGKAHFKGGVATYDKIKAEIIRLCHDSNAVCTTTMFDYYGLPDDFPGMKDRPPGSKIDRVLHIETAFASDIADRRFIPYLALHEFEAVLFASPEMIAQRFPEPGILETLNEVRAKFEPEEINDDMPPSKRLLKLIPYYQKPADGSAIARNIGLDRIRAECPHFNQWITTLETLGDTE